MYTSREKAIAMVYAHEMRRPQRPFSPETFPLSRDGVVEASPLPHPHRGKFESRRIHLGPGAPPTPLFDASKPHRVLPNGERVHCSAEERLIAAVNRQEFKAQRRDIATRDFAPLPTVEAQRAAHMPFVRGGDHPIFRNYPTPPPKPRLSQRARELNLLDAVFGVNPGRDFAEEATLAAMAKDNDE